MIVDGTLYEVKVSRTVWSRGKIRDNIKDLPITITYISYIFQNNMILFGTVDLFLLTNIYLKI